MPRPDHCACASRFPLLLAVAAGCVPPPAVPPPRPAAHALALPAEYDEVTPETLPAVIERLAITPEAGEQDSARAERHRVLAILCLHPLNPAPRYKQGLTALETAATLRQSLANDPQVGAWLVALRQLVEITRERETWEEHLAKVRVSRDKAAAEGQRRRAELETTKAELQAAIEHIGKLEATIEKLQRLDLKMEKRRQSVR